MLVKGVSPFWSSVYFLAFLLSLLFLLFFGSFGWLCLFFSRRYCFFLFLFDFTCYLLDRLRRWCRGHGPTYPCSNAHYGNECYEDRDRYDPELYVCPCCLYSNVRKPDWIEDRKSTRL